MPKRVLVVEDDVLVRLVVCHHLKSMGWQVRAAESGRDALRLIADNSDRMDVILTDLRLPDMHGVDLVRRAEVGCPFVFMSGTPDSTSDLPGPVLRKPFGEKALRAAFAEIAMTQEQQQRHQ
jgi:CheY-like chemotaxis protein